MKRLKFQYLIIFLLSSCYIFPQTPGSIDVIVSDSIHLKPVGFTYSITFSEKKDAFFTLSFQDNNESDDGGAEKAVEKQAKKPSPPDIESILKKNRFNYTISTNIDYSIGKSNSSVSTKSPEIPQDGPTFIVKLKTKDELEKLTGLFSSTEGITGKVINVEHESSEAYKKELFSKLYLKAQKEANMIASVSGSKLGKLISVTEVKEDWSFFKDLIDKFGSMIPFNLFDSENPFLKFYERKMQFKFEML